MVPKILTVYYKHRPGGFCQRLRMKIEAYLNKGWHVHYVAVEPYPYTHANLHPHIIPTPMLRHDSLLFWLYFFLTAPIWVFITAAKHKIDLFSIFSTPYAAITGPAKLILNKPMLMFIRVLPHQPSATGWAGKFLDWVESAVEKLGLIFSTQTFANSMAIKSAMIEAYGNIGKKIQILHNNIEEIQFDRGRQREKLLQEFSLDKDCFVVSTSGVLAKRKNFDFLIEAAAESKLPNLIVLIIGEGDQLQNLKALAARLGVRVVFPGWRDDVLSLIQGTDLFVFPSSREGMSNSLLEALACRLPCLVSSSPENREVVEDPEQQFDLDRPLTLALKITRMAEDPEYRSRIRESILKARERFLFDWSAEVVERAEKLLKPFL